MLTRDGTAEPVSVDQILRHARGQGNAHFPCTAEILRHEQDWQPYPVDPYSAICDDHTYMHTLFLQFYLLYTTTVRYSIELPVFIFLLNNKVMRQHTHACTVTNRVF